MKIGVASQNFRTVTGHAGKTRRFLIYSPDGHGGVTEVGRLDLPREMSLHEFHGAHHPLFDLDALVVGSCGNGFRQRLAAAGVVVATTSEQQPAMAAAAYLAGTLPPAAPHEGHR
jgi:predicted Fe-Mo cluster-binding NifX family protein